MKRILSLMVALLFLNCSFGQLSHNLNKTHSIVYSYYPTINHSSIGIYWLGLRYNPYGEVRGEGNHWNKIDNHGNVVDQDYDIEVDFFPVTWLFPNALNNTWGSVHVSLAGARLRFGRGRLKPFLGAELVGFSTKNELFCEKELKGVVHVNSASFGASYYLTKELILFVSAGAMVRSFQDTKVQYIPEDMDTQRIVHTLYPFISLSLQLEPYHSSFRKTEKISN